jgi:predicted small integral membrane protein
MRCSLHFVAFGFFKAITVTFIQSFIYVVHKLCNYVETISLLILHLNATKDKNTESAEWAHDHCVLICALRHVCRTWTFRMKIIEQWVLHWNLCRWWNIDKTVHKDYISLPKAIYVNSHYKKWKDSYFGLRCTCSHSFLTLLRALRKKRVIYFFSLFAQVTAQI